MDRREFITVVTGRILAAPLDAGSQQAGRVYRVGYLGPSRESAYFLALRDGF